MDYNIEMLKRRRTRDKSGKARWADSMSPEAKIAMELAIEDTKVLKQEEEDRIQREATMVNGPSRSPTRVAFADEHKDADAHPEPPQPKFSDLFERNGSARMRRDLTDDGYSEESESKKALGGGKVESAMEIVEIVNRDDPAQSNSLDEQAIEELARINSVDKCTVWIEATQGHQDSEGGEENNSTPVSEPQITDPGTDGPSLDRAGSRQAGDTNDTSGEPE